MRLSVTGACKSFTGTTVLKDVDLTVREGEVVALLGENGAGKSTLSAIIAGLIKPDAGTMVWEGQPYAPASPGDAMAHGIGLIHQEMRLLPDLTIAENVFVGRLPMTAGPHRPGPDAPPCLRAVAAAGTGYFAGYACRGCCASPLSSRSRSPRR